MTNFISILDINNYHNYKGSLEESLKLINYNFPHNINNVVIKPNLCYYWKSSTGYTTDPELVKDIILLLREKFGEDTEIFIAEADASAMMTKMAFKVLGYEKIAKETNATLINLSDYPSREINEKINGKVIKFNLPKILNETDLLINVPKLKIMKETKITCAMKNLFGAISDRRKINYHRDLVETIVAVNKVIKPHLNIVDGKIVLGQYPKKLDVIISGTSALFTDWIVSQIAGYDPKKVKFLELGLKENIEKKVDIKLVGDDISNYINNFPKNSIIPTNLIWKMQFALLNLYTIIVGDIVPPILDEY